MGRLDLDKVGGRHLPLDQARGCPWNQPVVPRYEAHDRHAYAGQGLAYVAVRQPLQAAPDGVCGHAGENLLMQLANGRRDPAAQHQENATAAMTSRCREREETAAADG